MTTKQILRIVFITVAILNIIVASIKWYETEENQFPAIGGWLSAIIFCIHSI